MKRVLFLAAILATGWTVVAQERSMPAPLKQQGKADLYKSVQGKEKGDSFDFSPKTALPSSTFSYGDFTEYETMITNFDLQSNGFIANRMVQWEDGTVAVTAILSSTGTASAPDRGTGYNYFDGTSFSNLPNARIEGIKTGWPSLAQYGKNGEIVVAHTGSNLVYYTRSTKGQGAWQGPKSIPNPNLGVSAQIMTWPRVITSGPNNDIIHVLAADQDFTSKKSFIYYAKSTDGENWEISFFPELGDDAIGSFSSDNYAFAANGDVVAALFTGSVTASTYIVKSEDNGQTWSKEMVWENPYDGLDWETDPASIFTDTLYAPETGAIAIDKNGLVHVALSVHEFAHTELGTSYGFFYGASVDGIMYWNESMGQMVSPDGNPHHVCRLWWPDPENPGYVAAVLGDYFIGHIPDITDWNNDSFYNDDYKSYFQGASVLPSITVDESGSIAVAFSCPDNVRHPDANNKYYRSIYVSYFDGYQWFVNEEYLQEDFMHMMDECIGVTSIQNSKNNEFWISYSADYIPGFGIGNAATQGEITENTIWAVKVVPNPVGWNVGESINPMTQVSVRPNPVQGTLFIDVNASQSSAVEISIHNITGQKVYSESGVNVSTGINTKGINVGQLTSGIYFVTVTANGFQETQKIVVK